MENWEDVFEGSDTNVIFNNFLNTYLRIFNACFTKSIHNSPHRYNPWITRGIKTSYHNKRLLYVTCKESNDTILKLRYKIYCKILTNVTKGAKKMYYDELIFISKNKTKTTRKIIKKETGKNCYNCHSNIKSLKIDNSTLNDPQEVANTFSDYFSTVADTVIGNIEKGDINFKDNVNPLNYLITKYNNVFSRINWKYATTHEIIKILKSIKAKNLFGYDEIPIKILKLSAPFIISPLTFICNKSLSSGVFPERLKYAIIKPIYKKGDKLLPTNYRPHLYQSPT